MWLKEILDQQRYRNGNFMAISKDWKKFEISKGIEIQMLYPFWHQQEISHFDFMGTSQQGNRLIITVLLVTNFNSYTMTIKDL